MQRLNQETFQFVLLLTGVRTLFGAVADSLSPNSAMEQGLERSDGNSYIMVKSKGSITISFY